MSNISAQAAHQVKQQVSKMTQVVFNVVAEDGQGPHIHQQVQESGMHEHGAEKRYKSYMSRERSGQPLIDMARKKSVLRDKSGLIARTERDLEEEDQGIEDD